MTFHSLHCYLNLQRGVSHLQICLSPMLMQETFADVFRGCRKKTLAQNRLMKILCQSHWSHLTRYKIQILNLGTELYLNMVLKFWSLLPKRTIESQLFLFFQYQKREMDFEELSSCWLC